ncbi:MAG TPA: TetR/AcrR family transcriptional regulator [Mycobacterium sp.]|nr:TetR/AcrR family transcriptional regulator [Mycobacterium sp.]HUH71097.1 TetR/AcrR family transcriptional regulator [Mycobacterium sp.]
MSAIREATRAELAEHGYPGVTFEGVARRARTSKPVLYRRYRSRAHMIVDALFALPAQPVPASATPSLREDMLTLLDAMMDRFHRIGVDTYRSLIADADDELLDTITAQLAKLADQTIYRALSDARDRGEIGTADIPDRAATTIVALMRNEVFFTRNPVDQETLTDMLDNVYLPLIDAVSHRDAGLPAAAASGAQRGATMPLS